MADERAGPILLTGAAGQLGSWLRPHLAQRPEGLRSADIRPFGPAIPGEAIAIGDLDDAAAVERMVEGTSAIVHFGGVSAEDSFERILRANIVGVQNVLDAARAGIASSASSMQAPSTRSDFIRPATASIPTPSSARTPITR